jgi:hypothetical protein
MALCKHERGADASDDGLNRWCPECGSRGVALRGDGELIYRWERPALLPGWIAVADPYDEPDEHVEPVALDFEYVELVEEARPSFDAEFSLGTIGTSPDAGRRGWMVQFDGLLEGECADEPAARRAAIHAARAQLDVTMAELDAAIAALERE